MAQDTNWENGSFSAPVAADTPDWESGEFAAPHKRTWGEAIKDTGAQLAEGVNTTLGAIPSAIAPQSKAAGFFRDNAEHWRDQQSDVLKGRIAETDKRIQEAGKDGVMSQIGTAASEYWNDPAQAARLVATNLPSMAATLGTGAAAGFAAKGVAAARGMDAAGKAALAAKYGTTTAAATNAALNAGGARGEAFEDLQQTALAQGMSPEQAEQAGVSGSILPGVVGGVAGAISGKIGLEKALLGQATTGAFMRKAGGAFGAELAGEQIEELAPKVATNYQVGQLDAARGLTDDVGRTIVETAIGSGPGAVVAGGAAGMRSGDQPPVDPATAPGAADPSAPVPPGAAPVEAPDLQATAPATEEAPSPIQPEAVEPAPLTPEQRMAELDERMGFIDQQAKANGWDKRLIGARDAAQAELDALRPASEASAATPAVDPRPLSEQMGIDPAAGPLSKGAALAVDSGVTDQMQQAAQAAQAAKEFSKKAPAAQDSQAQAAIQNAATAQAELPPPTNLREGLERIRARRQEAANAQTATTPVAAATAPLPAARAPALEAAGPATIPATTGVARESQASQAQQGSTQSTQAGGAARPAATAAPRTAPAGGSGLQTGGLTNATASQNDGAQGQAAPGAQAQAPQTAVARPDGWRKSLLRAGPVAKAMGIETRGKRLAQIVAEIDAADAQRAGVRQDGADLAAGQIDREWSAFAPETGTLGVPRAEMPQIKAEHRGALVNFLKARGIDSRADEVPANDLKPTQAEFSPAKVAKARGFQGGDRSILVSSDGYVVDGHHQWLAKRANGEPVKVIRLQAPIRQVLAQTAEFPSTASARGAAQPNSTSLADLHEANGPHLPSAATRTPEGRWQPAVKVGRGGGRPIADAPTFSDAGSATAWAKYEQAKMRDGANVAALQQLQDAINSRKHPTGAPDAATPRNLRLADERAPGVAVPTSDRAGPTVGSAAPAVGAEQRAGGDAAQPTPAVRAAVPDAGGASQQGSGVAQQNRPPKWRGNMIAAAQVAKGLGIDVRKYKRTADLVRAIDEADGKVETPKPEPQTAKGDEPMSVGTAPGSSEPVTVRDGVVYLGKYEALNYDTGEPVTVPKGSTREDVMKALREAGVLTKKDKAFGLREQGEQLMFSRAPGKAQQARARDAEHLSAVERGDMATAQRLVNEAAAEAGYVGSDYRMQHEAPSAENDGVRLDELRDNGLVPDDYWTHPQWYVSTPEEAAAHRAVVAAMRSADARKAAGKSPGSVAMVVYRAIPKTVKDGAIRNGDWVTPSLEYAKLEGESIPGGYRIISLPASAKNLYWDGNSVAEFGYDDGQSYGYKNTKNNRKLLDAVTRDDDGAVIPLSQRFNARNGDVRFSRAQPAISSAAAAMEEASRRADALYDAEPGTVTPEEFSAVGDARRAAEAAMLDALAQLPDSGFAVEARTSDGRMLIVTPSASEQGRWQLTRFGKDGEPWGDTRFDTKRQALQYLVDEAVPSSIKPAGAAMSRTVQPLRTPAATPPADSNARNVATQMLVDGLKEKWTRAPEIIVARNMQDPHIPQRVRDYDAQLKSQGSDGEARGFIYKGKVYLLSDQLKGPQQIAEVLFHEVLGHYGLRGAFGDALTPILNQVGLGRRKEVLAKAREYGMVKKGMSDADTWAAMSLQDRLSAAEEVLAELAQSRPEIGFVQRAIAAIRNWLRANVPGFDKLALTDADIVQAYLLPARGFVTRSKETGAQSLERAMLAFSRGDAKDQTQTEAFKRWFAGSKAVDADGKPLQVFHGTGGDFSVFTRERAGATSRAANAGMGFFFTDRPEVAGRYAQMAGGDQNVMPVYLAMQNPLRLTAKNMMEADKLLQAELQPEHDGAIVEVAMQGGGTQTVYMARESSQIKSATGNRGTFDANNPDIRFSRSVAADGAAQRAGDAIKAVSATNLKQRADWKATDYLGLGLQTLGRRQIVDIYGDALPLAQYNKLAAQMEADKNEVGAHADKLATAWGKLKDERQLAELMHDATLAQMDPAKEHVPGDDQMRYKMLRARFNALTPGAKQVYLDARSAYQAHHANVRQAIKDRIERSELKGERKAALLKQMDDEFFKAVKGVYFPLARFGQYVVVVKDADGKVASVNRAETMAEAQALRTSLLKAFPTGSGHTVARPILGKEFVASRDAVGRGFMTELYAVLDKQDMDAAARAELEDTLGQLYLSSLPDLSWAKHGIHRKGTPGFSQDARRAYAQNMFHGARYLAKLRYSDLMQDELNAMQQHVDEWKEVEDFDQPKAQRVVDEMNKRHESLMNPKSNPLSTALTSFGFIFHLGLSPASAMVNLSQTALVAYPVMGAKWGFGKASAALLKASGEAARGKNDITGALTAQERQAYDEAVRTGVIDVTMAHDLAGIAQGEDAGVMWKLRPVMKWASFMFHHAERFNRQVTFVAAYRLAREAGASHESAYEQAADATYKGHFDYSASNRPRIMQGNTARVLLLFKQYGQNMIYTLARSAHQSLKGATPEARAEARKTLGGLLTMHAAAAGVLGLPMVSTLLAAASMLGGDDDEPWDAEVALQNLLADTFGQKSAEVLAHGLSRLTPWDVSGRVGLDRLIFPDVQEGLEGQRLAESAMTAALGPVAGIGVNVLKGVQEMSQGRYLRGLEAMAPSVARGPLKALRYESEGVKDKSGIVVQDEVDAAALWGQAAGFSPSDVRRSYEGKSAIVQHDRALQARRSALVEQFAMAAMAGDESGKTEAREDIAKFNEKNPARRILPLNLMQSVAQRQKRIREAKEGVYLPAKRRDAMEQGRFAAG